VTVLYGLGASFVGATGACADSADANIVAAKKRGILAEAGIHPP
jgi:hypothetical protein